MRRGELRAVAEDEVPAVAPKRISTPAGREGQTGALPTWELLRRRWEGTNPVDEWGLDPDLVDFVSPLLWLRWRIDVEEAQRLPAQGPAMVVFNRRWGLSEAAVVTRGLRKATGRFIRPLGVPDVALFGPLARRFGAVQSLADQVAGLLKAGEVVAVPLDREMVHRHHAGPAPLDHLTPAVVGGVPVIPVAAVGREVGRRWRLLVGEPVAPTPARGPLAVAELGDAVRRDVQRLLDRALPPSLLFR